MFPTIPADLQQFVDREVACGKFRSQEEVVAEGLRLLRERERKLDLLRKDLEVAIDQLERGEGLVIADEAAHQKLLEDIIRRCEAKSATGTSNT